MTAVSEADALRRAAAETDTFTFTIQNAQPDPKRTISVEAIEAIDENIKAWIAARVLHTWRTTGLAPKFVTIEVKVGVE